MYMYSFTQKSLQMCPRPSNKLKLTHAESLLQDKMSTAKADFESELINSFISSNLSKIYKYIRTLLRNHTLPQSMYLNCSSASTDNEKATLFNQYFHSVFTLTSFTLPPVSSLPTPSSSLIDIHISEFDTFEALNSISTSKASKCHCHLQPSPSPLHPVPHPMQHSIRMANPWLSRLGMA